MSLGEVRKGVDGLGVMESETETREPQESHVSHLEINKVAACGDGPGQGQMEGGGRGVEGRRQVLT